MPRSTADPGVVSSRRRTRLPPRVRPQLDSPAQARREPCRERGAHASSRFRDQSGSIRHAVMTGDGHSKDARMLTEVTNPVNRSCDIDAYSCFATLRPVPLDL